MLEPGAVSSSLNRTVSSQQQSSRDALHADPGEFTNKLSFCTPSSSYNPFNSRPGPFLSSSHFPAHSLANRSCIDGPIYPSKEKNQSSWIENEWSVYLYIILMDGEIHSHDRAINVTFCLPQQNTRVTNSMLHSYPTRGRSE